MIFKEFLLGLDVARLCAGVHRDEKRNCNNNKTNHGYLLTKVAIGTANIQNRWGAEKIDYQTAKRKTNNVRKLL